MCSKTIIFRARVAVSVGFHGAVGFPIKLDNEFFGVLELFSRETKERDHEFQEMVANLGTQLGQFVERQRAETALRSEARLQLALSAGQMGAWEWNINARKITWSSSLEVIHGLKRGSFGGAFEDLKKTIHPEDLEAVLSQIQTTLETRSDYEVAYRIVHPDGQIRWVEALASLSYRRRRAPGEVSRRVHGYYRKQTSARNAAAADSVAGNYQPRRQHAGSGVGSEKDCANRHRCLPRNFRRAVRRVPPHSSAGSRRVVSALFGIRRALRGGRQFDAAQPTALWTDVCRRRAAHRRSLE